MTKNKLKLIDFTKIALATAIICVLSLLSFPLPNGVPVSMQTFAVPLVAVILGAKRGAIASIIYICLGLIGLPVFSGFTSGIGVLFGPTGGFILSFPIFALFAGLGAEKNTNLSTLVGISFGAIINYLCGMAVFSAVTQSSLKKAFLVCVMPFILTDIFKFISAVFIGKRCQKALLRVG